MDPDEELIQIAERQLADAEEAYRQDPSAANQRRIVKRWDAVREARGASPRSQDSPVWPLTRPRPPMQ